MTDTYSSRPFISHDGPDENSLRAEVKVVTGLGRVDSIEPSKKGKSAKVSFEVSNTQFKSAGWAPTGSNVIDLVESAKENDEAVYFRIETRRQDHVDRETPIEELSKDATTARDNIYKSLSAVKREDDDTWTVSQYAVTNMAEDPKGGMRSANDYTLEELNEMKGESSDNSARSNNNVSHGIEGTPFQLYNPSGDLNPGSAAVAVPLNIYTYLVEYLKENEIEISDKAKIVTVRAILKACNELQLAIYGGALTKPNLIAGSHTRARALVFESIRTFFPLMEDTMTDTTKLGDWITETVSKTTAMWKWSMSEVLEIVE